MITVEYSKTDALITILDKTGRYPDLQLMFENDGHTLFLRQIPEDSDEADVIEISLNQVSGLLQVLQSLQG
jgi:hypothetical protein